MRFTLRQVLGALGTVALMAAMLTTSPLTIHRQTCLIRFLDGAGRKAALAVLLPSGCPSNRRLREENGGSGT